MYGNKGTSSAEHCITFYLQERVHHGNPLSQKTKSDMLHVHNTRVVKIAQFVFSSGNKFYAFFWLFTRLWARPVTLQN